MSDFETTQGTASALEQRKTKSDQRAARTVYHRRMEIDQRWEDIRLEKQMKEVWNDQ